MRSTTRTRRPSRSLLWLLVPLLAACAATGAPATAPQTEGLPEIDLQGHRIIGCCCPTPCPCRLNKKPTYRHGCDYTTAVLIERGTIDGVPMDGVEFTFVGRSFARDTGRNYVYVYVDEEASEEQLAALQTFFGIEGGAHEANGRGPYVPGEVLGMRPVPIRYSVTEGGLAHACEIEGVLDLRTRAIVNPGRGEPVKSVNILDSFGDAFVHADCLAHVWNDPELPSYAVDLTGRQSNFASFDIDTEDVRRLGSGGLGWSCWSAHEDFDDDAPYEEELIDCCGHG